MAGLLVAGLVRSEVVRRLRLALLLLAAPLAVPLRGNLYVAPPLVAHLAVPTRSDLYVAPLLVAGLLIFMIVKT
jgi:hypothetical protein